MSIIKCTLPGPHCNHGKAKGYKYKLTNQQMPSKTSNTINSPFNTKWSSDGALRAKPSYSAWTQPWHISALHAITPIRITTVTRHTLWKQKTTEHEDAQKEEWPSSWSNFFITGKPCDQAKHPNAHLVQQEEQDTEYKEPAHWHQSVWVSKALCQSCWLFMLLQSFEVGLFWTIYMILLNKPKNPQSTIEGIYKAPRFSLTQVYLHGHHL